MQLCITSFGTLLDGSIRMTPNENPPKGDKDESPTNRRVDSASHRSASSRRDHKKSVPDWVNALMLPVATAFGILELGMAHFEIYTGHQAEAIENAIVGTLITGLVVVAWIVMRKVNRE